MNIRFIEFLEEKIEQISKSIIEHEKEYDELEKNGIDLKEYGGRYEARRIFNAYHGEKTSTIGKVFNITTKKDLEEFIKSRETKKLQNKINQLQQDKLSLKRAISYYKEGKFIGFIYPNDEIVRSIYEAGIENILSVEEIVKLIVSLCKNIPSDLKRRDEVITAEQAISNSFTENYEIAPTVNKEKVGLLFAKLVLATQRETRRGVFLKDAEVSNYLKQVASKENIEVPNIDKEGNIKRDPRTTEILNRHLDVASISLILKGYDLLEKTEDEEVKRILTRSIKNIISQCIYYDLVKDDMTSHSNLDILTERIAILRNIIETLTIKDATATSFLYQKNADGLPKILEDINLVDPLSYHQIYKILKDIANGNMESKEDPRKNDITKIRCELIKEEDETKFYAATYENYSIIFSTINGRVLIHRLVSLPLNRIKDKIGQEEIETAKYYKENKVSDTAELLSEGMIIETLDLKEQVEVNTFKRRR